MDTTYDFSGWATRANMKCSDGRTIMKDAFIENDGASVPLVWNHQHNDPFNVLGHALLKNMEEGVYAYCKFNDSESGRMGKEMVKNGDVNQLSIYANQLKQQGGNVLHGAIREVSLVLAGANPGAYIDSIMCHGAESDEAAVIYTGEDIELVHAEDANAEEETTLVHASDDKQADENGEGAKKEEKSDMAEAKKDVKDEVKEEVKEEVKDEVKTEPEAKTETKEKTVQDVWNGILAKMTDEEQSVIYALIDQAAKDAASDDKKDADEKKETKETKEDNENIKHSEGGNEIMHTNVFDREAVQQVNVLSHADQQEIIKMAKQPGVGSLKAAMAMFAENHKDTLAHGIDQISELFPDFKDVKPGAPELLERDQSWVAQVMNKAKKSPVSRVRTRQLDARAKEIKAKGYNNRESEKTVSGNLKVLMRTTDPQTVYYRDALHRDDVTDITDFDVVAYQKNVMKHNMEEIIALAALVGDGREDTDPDKIHQEHIRSVWQDEDLYTIKADVDVEAMAEELQGTNANANFGENFIFAEAFITKALYAREQYKGKGALDLYVAPHTLNKILLARDLNGRRIYDSANDVAKVLNVANIYTVEQFEGLTRVDDEDKTHALLGIFVNMANYQFGCTKGGEITTFEQFDIDFNNHKYLMEARLSGALVEVCSAIAMEQLVDVAAG